MDVALHFEFLDLQENLKLLDVIRMHQVDIKKDVSLDFEAAPWTTRWAHAKFHLPLRGGSLGPEIAPQAAEVMKILIERTYPLIEPYVKKK